MTIQEIQNRKEDQTFDCKSIQIDPKALAIPIVAFANADGGVIVIGVSDKSRTIEGVDQDTRKLNDLLRVPFDFCNPSFLLYILMSLVRIRMVMKIAFY